jgi:hypothetical protein
MGVAHSLVVDECDGEVAVADREFGRVHRFDLQSRQFIGEWRLGVESGERCCSSVDRLGECVGVLKVLLLRCGCLGGKFAGREGCAIHSTVVTACCAAACCVIG